MNNYSASDQNNKHLFERRNFISTTFKAACATALISAPVFTTAIHKADPAAYTVQDIIDLVLKEIPGAPFKKTVDTIKSGDAGQQVTGIVTTMFSTIKVIEEAAKLNANFIIAHEPTFYNHTDDKNWIDKNEIVKKKVELLEKHKITVWRFHDYWHSYLPDGIRFGILKSTGWQKYYKPEKMLLKMPPLSLKNIIDQVKSSLNISHVKVIGNLEQVCESIALLPGAAGGQRQMSLIEKEKPDVLIVGEVHEWETAEYIRDARALGAKTSLIILGHSVSEEPGMQWLVEWLQPKIGGIRVTHIHSGDPFIWV